MAVLFRKKSFSKYILYGSIFLTVIFTNDFIANIMLRFLEGNPVTVNELGRYKTGVVLTGVLRSRELPDGRANFSEGADRITDAVLLYRKGVIEKILVTGGSPLIKTDHSESEKLSWFLRSCEIPEEDIIIEEEALNTYQNALYTARLLEKRNESEKILLITSAFHMRRASACFSRQNVEHDVFPTDFLTHPIEDFSLDYIFPSEEALRKWNHLNKELFGFVVYKLVGYI